MVAEWKKGSVRKWKEENEEELKPQKYKCRNNLERNVFISFKFLLLVRA